MENSDYFAIKREALKRTHEKTNTALTSCHRQFDEETQRLENLDNDIVTYNTNDDGEDSIQVKDHKLPEHISKRLETLSSGLEEKFKGACLEWVEKEQKLGGKRSGIECAERWLGLYEEMVERLQKLDWEILGVEEEEWKKSRRSAKNGDEAVGRDEQGDDGDDDVGGGGNDGRNVTGMNDVNGKRAEAEYDEQVEMSAWRAGAEVSGRGKNVWTGDELLEESSGSYVEVTAQNVSDDFPEVDDKNCATQ